MTVRGEGWYADPQDAGMLRWWDGAAWTHHTHSPAVPTAHFAPLARWWAGLTIALQIGFLVNLAMSLYVLYVDREVLGFVEDLRLRRDSVSEADGVRIDQLVQVTAVELVPFLITGILLVVWTYTAHHSARMDRSVLRHSSGWAIGGWFVPGLSLWRPFQMVLDLRRGATGKDDLPITRTLGWWWATFLTSYAMSLVAGYYFRRLDTTSPAGKPDEFLDVFASGATWDQWSSVITIVSALLAIRVVREVRALVRAERT